ncbi:MAG: esterase [Lachnospiraceae bacterium]|nr:esterase [Lachnospiraceae bacterium]
MESTVLSFGNPDADSVLIQMADGHSIQGIESEVAEIRRLTDRDFCLICLKVRNWNDDLSPWEAPPVFGKDGFAGLAEETLSRVLQYTGDQSKSYYIGGYSLAGLFAIWSAYQTDIFKGVAAASPSVWFPGFVEYMKEHRIKAEAVYLSLGDKEDKAKNPVMASVGERIKDADEILKGQGAKTVLEWNTGNHFTDAGLRTAKAFAWVLK